MAYAVQCNEIFDTYAIFVYILTTKLCFLNGKYLQRNGACETNEDYTIGQVGILHFGKLPWFR